MLVDSLPAEAQGKPKPQEVSKSYIYLINKVISQVFTLFLLYIIALCLTILWTLWPACIILLNLYFQVTFFYGF